MNILIRRRWIGKHATVSELSIDGEPQCFVLEDPVREVPGQPVESWKVKGDTAIPVGRYKVAVTFSSRFQRPLPLLVDVPGYDGVRIHTGNTPADTEGCLLPGRKVVNQEAVAESKLAFDPLFARITAALQDGDEVWCEIVNDPTTEPLP